MDQALLILNAGSSSLKFSLYQHTTPLTVMIHGNLEELNTAPHFVAYDAQGSLLTEQHWPTDKPIDHMGAIQFLLDWLQQGPIAQQQLLAAGHRIVHGGPDHDRPARIDDSLLVELERLTPMAPLHQPHHLTVIRAVQKSLPALPQVACFDTSFHRSQPAVAQAFALPKRYTDAGLHRYGFHGISYEYLLLQLRQRDPQLADGKLLLAHLGNGSSLCAVVAGLSVATTMGFTPLDGLPMGTRCGTIDPGILLYLLQQEQLEPDALEHLLYHESGLLGVSGIASDMRTLEQLAATEPAAAAAIELFIYRSSREIGSLVAAMKGLDGIVFTGGIGENSASIRARICETADWLGVQLDKTANLTGATLISAPESQVAVWVIPTDEEWMIAQQTCDLLNLAPA